MKFDNDIINNNDNSDNILTINKNKDKNKKKKTNIITENPSKANEKK